MKVYKLFLWLLFVILVSNGCEDLELDSQVENEPHTKMNSDVVLNSASNLKGARSSSSNENLSINEVANILDLPQTSLPGKTSAWYFAISEYTGSHEKISLSDLHNLPYWNASRIKDINIFGRPSTNDIMYYDGRDYRFIAMPSCLWTEKDSSIHFNKGNVGIGTMNPPYPLTVIGETYGIYGFGSDYGISGEGSKYGVRGHGSVGVWGDGTTGISGFGSTHGVKARGDVYDFYADGSGTNYGPFTGGHEVKLSKGFPRDADIRPGMLVSVTGETQLREGNSETTSLSSTLPTVELSAYTNDKKVFGVFTKPVPLPEDHWFYDKIKAEDRFATVNSLGEGRVLVTNLNGEIEAGDYITTSNVPGYGMKQDDDLLHNYTLGKAIEDLNWSEVEETVEYNGKKYKVYLISVVYTSG